MSNKKLLIDGDLMLYKFSYGNEVNIDWGDGQVSSITDLETAKEEVKDFYNKLLKATDTTSGLICFSCPKEENFRYQVLPTYKHNRKDRERPQLYYDLKQFILDNYETKTKPTIEADDVLGIMATMKPGQYVIASIDKDLRQIPGEHYNWKDNEYFTVNLWEANNWFYTQILVGDTCDGYKGCPGIGKKKAEMVLQEAFDFFFSESNLYTSLPEVLWTEIIKVYESKGLTEEDALQQARVARILRAEDWDFKKGEVKLWNP